MKKYHLISLGCPKNLVDSEIFANIIENNNYIHTTDKEEADIILINTCGFIQDAKTEAIETILEATEITKNDENKKTIVTGCFVGRYFSELKEEIPEVDNFIDLKDFVGFTNLFENEEVSYERKYLTPNHYGYLRIADGCDNKCTYCAIPLIRGDMKSVPMEEVIKEANRMADSGIKEIIISAQDTTQYGVDLYKERRLAKLLIELHKIEKIKWIRLLYLHPAHLDENLINTIASLPKVCKYFDVPLQHISDKLLKKMNRKAGKEATIAHLKMIKEIIPEAVLRTTFIVGFPGETRRDFLELREFIKEFQFGRMGVFEYSPEEDTPAYNFEKRVTPKTAQKRKDELMMIQQDISTAFLASFVGKELDVIIDEISQTDEFDYEGRTRFDAPDEIDGLVYIISDKKLNIGDIVKIKIIDSWEYDLVGEY